MDTLNERKREFAREFSRAESSLKAYEHAGNNTLTGSINELRYAGSHMSSACMAELAGDLDKAQEELVRAIRHAKRARYDVLEARVCYAMTELEEAMEFYKGYEYLAASIIKDYLLHKKQIRTLGAEMANMGDLDKESPEYQAICERRVGIIDSFLEDFHDAQEALIDAMRVKEKEVQHHEKEIALLGASLEQANKATMHAWIASAIFCLLGAVLGWLLARIFPGHPI